ncbi:ParB/RepB/Spo0J family partition protein [Indioceanicola profundi]|uniref:ParB/RepB/Spo0J family partition protein n=1 Tax=Indioceanicola profundi TaxID=2220096 RepID=UPI000E6AC06D|nr:ParB/RepB/Spo0J family partition protein [Indioceanicola profundi]
MAGKAKRPSPILGAASAMIGDASDTLVTRDSRFRHTFEAPLERIRADPGQPRKRFDAAEIQALAATMAEQGQLQPILVRRDPDSRAGWIIVAGERRWRAAALNGWPALLAIEHSEDPEVAALIENLQRVDLTPVEEARGLQRLIEGKGWSQNQAAQALGKSKGEVSATLRILSLPEEILDGVLTSELDIPRNALVELARIESGTVRDQLVELARKGMLTVRSIRAAREAEEQKSTVQSGEPAPTRTGSKAGIHFSVRGLEKMTTALHAARTAGHTLGAEERRCLEQLKAEIDSILAGGT